MGNDKVRIKEIKLLSDNWYTLNKLTFDYQLEDGRWEEQQREVYDRGNGAAILLYNKEQGTVVLTKQFRMPSYLNGNTDGMMIEVPAGLLDADDPETCKKKEAEEETGYRVTKVKKIFEAYMSPGAVTEILHYFTAEYTPNMKVGKGGGKDDETEYIEVIEMPFTEALEMVKKGEIKDAKSMLLLQYAQLHGLV